MSTLAKFLPKLLDACIPEEPGVAIKRISAIIDNAESESSLAALGNDPTQLRKRIG